MSFTLSHEQKTGQGQTLVTLIHLCSERSQEESKLRGGNLPLRCQPLEILQGWEKSHVAIATKKGIGTHPVVFL
jgi:hypothetical protein